MLSRSGFTEDLVLDPDSIGTLWFHNNAYSKNYFFRSSGCSHLETKSYSISQDQYP